MLKAGDRAAVARAARSRDFRVLVGNRVLKLTLHWTCMAHQGYDRRLLTGARRERGAGEAYPCP